MNSILKIPGNEHSLEIIRQRIQGRNALAFVGAGASAGLYPLWKQLIITLSDEAVKRGLSDSADRNYWIQQSDSRPEQIALNIKEKLGQQIFYSLLQEIFAPRVGNDGKRYTPIQGALLRMSFKGLVTTNYDPGLIEARHLERPDILYTGYGTWKDKDIITQWLTGDIFSNELCPILFAHGFYQRSDTIVLGADEYQAAYRPGLYRRLFEKLWSQERLVFIGFSFSDAWLNFIATNVIADVASSAADYRHVAVIGLRQDQHYSPEMRRLFHNTYNAEVLFYPIIMQNGIENHSALLPLLTEISGAQVPSQRNEPPSILPDSSQPLKELWVHETTNDERYSGNQFAMERLNRWGRDPEVKVIAITAMGGQGKTALIGHWLKLYGGSRVRDNSGLFYWSFYSDRTVNKFFAAFVSFAGFDITNNASSKKRPDHSRQSDASMSHRIVQDIESSLVQHAISAIEVSPFLIVLDGLEVLQERPGTLDYGALLEDDLRIFLDAACRRRHQSLIILTSRFPFADIMQYIGSSLRNFELTRLLPEEGATLLQRCEVGGTHNERELISRSLEGHPLALRVFAAALNMQPYNDPTRFWGVVFKKENLRNDDPFEGKLSRLLYFYENALPFEQRLILGTVALFSSPTDEHIILTLVYKQNGGDRTKVMKALQALINGGLLLREHKNETQTYYCHPVLRDHFRTILISKDFSIASDAAHLLTDRPSNIRPKKIEEIIPVVSAIEILLEAGFFKEAHNLYERRLLNGAILLSLPAVHEGRRCTLSFVANTDRQELCKSKLSTRQLSFYLNSVGIFARYAGEPEEAIKYFDQSLDISKDLRDQVNRTVIFKNMANTYLHLGDLSKAEDCARKAANYWSVRTRDNSIIGICKVELGYVLGLQGILDHALLAFKEANKYRFSELYDIRFAGALGIKQADLLLRMNRIGLARELSEDSLSFSKSHGWFNEMADCHLILGRIFRTTNNKERAEMHLRESENIFRQGHMLSELP